MLIFALDEPDSLGESLCAALDEPRSPHEDLVFEDGERKTRPLVDPRGDDVYVLASLHGGPQESPHDKLCRLLMFIATLRDHGAARVTAVVPYMAYGRKDRHTKPWDPLSVRYVAQLFEAVGTAQLIVLEAHNPGALQTSFRGVTIHVDAWRAFDAVLPDIAGTGPYAVASPDPGGVKRAQLWREALEHRLMRPVGFAMGDKRRSAGLVSGLRLVAGDVAGQTVLLLDDLIASGETMQRAAAALRHEGAREVIVLAAHGLFLPPAAERLCDPGIARVVITDSVPAFRLPPAGPAVSRLRVVSAAPWLAAAVRDSHAAWRR